jgi:hypothetical protein
MDPGTLYERPLLSQLAQQYKNREFIADQVLPVVDVDYEQFEYLVFDRGATFKHQNTKYGHDASANVLDLKATKVKANTDSHAMSTYIDEKEERQAPGIAIESLKTEALMDAIFLDREMEAAAFLTDTAKVTQNATLAGASQWSAAGSHPKQELLTRFGSILGKNITMVVGKQVDDVLRLHADIIEAVKYTRGAVETESIIASYFGVAKYLVGEAFVDTAAEGQAESLGYVWGKHCTLLHTPEAPNAMMSKASAGYIARWKGGAGGPVRVFTAKVPTRGTGQGATFIKAETDWKMVFTSQIHMFLLKNVVA